MSESNQELKDVLIVANKLVVILVSHLKDGFQPGSDMVAIVEDVLKNDALKSAAVEAIKNISALGSEVKALDLQAGLDLASVQLSLIPDLLAAFKSA